MTLHTKVGGIWKEIINNVTVRVSGTYRTVAQGYVKVSGTWRTMYLRDTTGPASPTDLKATWRNNGECYVTWTNPADSDYAEMQIQRTVRGLRDSVITIYTVAAPTRAFTLSDCMEGRIYTFLLTPVDTAGNLGTTVSVASMEWTGAARGRVASPVTFDPIDSETWLDGPDEWVSSDSDRVWQGSNSTEEKVGIFWYGTTPYDTLAGAEIESMAVNIYRTTQNGKAGAVPPEVRWSTSASRATSPPASSRSSATTTGTGICRNGTCSNFTQVSLPGSWHDNWFDPEQGLRARSVILDSQDTTLVSGLGNTSESYMEMYAWDQTGSGRLPGRITVVHGG